MKICRRRYQSFNQAINLLGIFDSIIDATTEEDAAPTDYAKWTTEKINTEIFKAYPKLKAKVANRMSGINKVMKTYSEDCEKVSQWY